jgi:endonuclease YncB( thermonuclease family)
MPTTLATNRFNKLIDDISRLYIKTRTMQVAFAWETGRRLVQEEQNGEMHAVYGTRLLAKTSRLLSKKFGPGFAESNLRRMRQFYLTYPKRAVTHELDWTDYVELLPIKDDQTRRRLETRAVKEDLTSIEIRQLVHKVREVPAKPARKLAPLKQPGDLKLNTFAKSKLAYKLPAGCVLLDCGFFVNWPVKQEKLKGVQVSDTPSYTYEATIDRVIDGDTLHVVIEVGFGIKVYDKLRLRGIDTPELGTPEGERAKKFVAALLPVGSTIIIKSHKTRTDLHGRFVVDVFYREGVETPEAILREPVYLNQRLIDEGLAVRMAE